MFGRNDIRGHDKDAHAIDGVWFYGDVESLTQSREGLDGLGCPLVGRLSPLFARLPEVIPIGIAWIGDELLHFGADVRRDGERLGRHLQGRIIVGLRAGDGGESYEEKPQEVRSNHWIFLSY